MTLTDASLKNPAAVAVIVALLCVFGFASLRALPLQLFPDIERPQMSIETSWRAASPQEIESEILEPQEAVLQGMPGLEQIDGTANYGNSTINLTFSVGTDLREAQVEVIGRLNRVPQLPPDVTPPVVELGGRDSNTSLSFFFVQMLPGARGQMSDYTRFIEERVIPRIEAVPGVAGVEMNGSPSDELRIDLDLDRAAALGVTIPEIARLAARANDISGGAVQDGRREYVLRFAGRYSPTEMGDLILAWRDGQPVRLADVATVTVQHPEQRFFAYQNGNPAIGLRVVRESGANVLTTLTEVKAVVAELRETVLKERGLGIEQSFDASLFIERAINLLSGNLFAGVLLAVGCLWWFLRDARATLLIASAIPVSLLATFVVLDLSGRSLNVISLAGLAFAVGMVMDAAVVVAENIVRLREAGKSPEEAALIGTRQVGGALIASTLTTIAVFVPVLFIRDVEGQLFADLALTISIAVAISLLVAFTVLPAAARGWLKGKSLASLNGAAYPRVTAMLMRCTDTRRKQLIWIGMLVLLPTLGAWLLAPRLDYLPPVKRAAIDAFFSFPPSMPPGVVDAEIAPTLLPRMRPFMAGEREPQLKNWYLLLWPGGGTLGARVQDEDRIGELETIVRDEVVVGLPDTRVFASEGDLFGGFGGSPRAIAIHLQSGDTDALARVAAEGRTLLEDVFPDANVQAFPEVDAVSPELRVTADDRRLAEVGWNRAELGSVVRVVGEGQWLGEYFDGDRRMPVMLGTDSPATPEALADVAVTTPLGGVVSIGDLADVRIALAPSQLRRVDRRRTITLTVDPPQQLSLEEALERIETQVVPRLREALPEGGGLRIAGSADRLGEVIKTMAGNFALALLVLFMLMAAMFRSLRDSAFVMLALPMAVFGGVLGLRALGLFSPQPLDLLTMIGFIMLLGMVVNNAILLVAQTRTAQAEGAGIDDAVAQALSQRLRPILIGALTGVVGALPLAMSPGAGAVIYRGLAAVTVGGVGLSLLFTLVLMPALLRLDPAFALRRGFGLRPIRTTAS